jgi:hypothetical protein
MWCLRLSDSQRDAVRELIKEQGELSNALAAALEALDYSRWDDLPDATLPWDHVAELAAAQNIGEADVVWDLAAGMTTPARQKPKPRKRPAKKAARRVNG